jgi:hypothetical protein
MRSNELTHRMLMHGSQTCRLFALAQTRRFASQIAEIIQLGAPNAASANQVDMVDHGSVHREDAFYTLPETYFSNRDGFAHTGVLASDDGALEGLETLLIALLDSHVHPDGIARAKFGMRLCASVFADEL